MQKYIKTYCDYFGYVEDEFIPSEISNKPAVDVHHIIFRSQCGKDNIENLIALTREEHDKAHASEFTVEFLQEKHLLFKKRYDKNNTTATSDR